MAMSVAGLKKNDILKVWHFRTLSSNQQSLESNTLRNKFSLKFLYPPRGWVQDIEVLSIPSLDISPWPAWFTLQRKSSVASMPRWTFSQVINSSLCLFIYLESNFQSLSELPISTHLCLPCEGSIKPQISLICWEFTLLSCPCEFNSLVYLFSC